MNSTIANNETKERIAPINIDANTFRENGYALVDKIAALMESLPGLPVTKGEQPKEIRSVLGNDTLPQQGTPIENIFQRATDLLFEHSLFNGSPRFWGYITAAPAPAGILADMLAAAVNPNVGANVLSPMATEIERQTIRWVSEFIGYPQNCGGIFVSGGNAANFTAFLAARKAKADWDIRETGLGNKKMLIYCSKGTHTWINKAADLFGFGMNNIRWIEMNEDQQMNTAQLEKQIIADREQGHLPFIVVGTAGSVSTGAIDPLDKIADICQRYNIWFHIDGAYGAPAAAVPEAAHLFKGMELADSIAFDPHKWLYNPLESGCVLIRNRHDLQNAFSFHPEYYNFEGKEDDPAVNFYEYGFQNSRGFRAFKTWILLQQAGRNGYVKMIRDDIQLAKKLFDLADVNKELEAVSNHLSITTFRYVPADVDDNNYLNQLNEEIVDRLQAGGEVFVSNAVIDNKYCLRACIVNFRTTEQDIESLIKIAIKTGKQVHEELR